MNQEKILITGATGLLGVPLVKHLRKRGFHVTAAGFKKKADVNFDLRSFADTAAQVSKVKPDVIVHLAADANVDRCEEQPELAYDLNVRPVESLVQAISGTRIHLICISTDQVYDGEGPHPESSLLLKNKYATSKYFSELSAQRAAATILRVNFFGKSQTEGRSSLSDWILTELRTGRKIDVFTDILFSPLSMSTLDRMIELAVLKRASGTFNLGSRNGLSKSAFAHRIAEAFSLPLELLNPVLSNSGALKAYRPKDMRMDVRLFERCFGTVLPTLAEEILSFRRSYDEAPT